MSVGIVIVLAVVLAWTLTSERLARWSVTAPVLLVGAGWAVSAFPEEAASLEGASGTIKTLAEVTLALVLFSDASQITARWFRREAGPAKRLLGIGLPLTVASGFLVGWLLFPGTDAWVIAVVAASLAPTDAALGASIMADRRIPLRIRQTINVESGLNDGLATPFVLFFIAAASATEERQSVATALGEALVEILVAVAVGALVGTVGGHLVSAASRAGWASRLQEPIGVLSLALLSYLVSVGLHGNGFVAAFVAGTAFGTAVARHRPPEAIDFTERFGLALSFGVWFVFGAVMVPVALRTTGWQTVVYAVLSLTLVRMLPVAISLLGTGWRADTVALVGWLGPRGLASIVFGLLAYETLGSGVWGDPVVGLISMTVLLSVLAHGLSAGPIASWYARRHPQDEESDETTTTTAT